MRRAGVHKFIFSSSATVYGTPEQVPLTETSRVGGTTNPYGTSKLMVEQILQDFAKAEPQFSITALRYFNPVGAHESGMIGEDPNGIPNNLMPYIAQVAIGKLEKLSILVTTIRPRMARVSEIIFMSWIWLKVTSRRLNTSMSIRALRSIIWGLG